MKKHSHSPAAAHFALTKLTNAVPRGRPVTRSFTIATYSMSPNCANVERSAACVAVKGMFDTNRVRSSSTPLSTFPCDDELDDELAFSSTPALNAASAAAAAASSSPSLLLPSSLLLSSSLLLLLLLSSGLDAAAGFGFAVGLAATAAAATLTSSTFAFIWSASKLVWCSAQSTATVRVSIVASFSVLTARAASERKRNPTKAKPRLWRKKHHRRVLIN